MFPCCLIIPPFFFVVWNGTNAGDSLNCSSQEYHLRSCWGSEDSALVVWIPGIVPLPVSHSGENQLTLTRHKRDFGIITAVITAIATTATAAAVSRIALSQSVVTASTVNKLSGEVAEALSTQNNLNAFIQLGILNLNQQTALLQETHMASCSPIFMHVCVTPPRVQNLTLALSQLNNYLKSLE